MKASNLVSMSDKAGGPYAESTDRLVSIEETLQDVTIIVAVAAFYTVFTESTGISVGDRGQVGELERLRCPDWFFSQVHKCVWGLFDEQNLTQSSDDVELATCVAYAATTARYLADKLARKNKTVLALFGLAQIWSAEAHS